MRENSYRVKSYDLHGLQGISDQTLEMHFGLYEGYVKATNTLTEEINEFLKDGNVDQEEMPAYSELTRRLGFEYNGMILHEYYFGNMRKEASLKPESDSAFLRRAAESFGNFESWKTDFVSVGKMRGVGWAICYQNPASGRLTNHWTSLHEHGHIAGFIPVLVMDLWEHAFLLDYAPSKRSDYVQAFFENIDWKAVDRRCDLRLRTDAVYHQGAA
jgi:Fe-Mn family superoxide dismutase